MRWTMRRATVRQISCHNRGRAEDVETISIATKSGRNDMRKVGQISGSEQSVRLRSKHAIDSDFQIACNSRWMSLHTFYRLWLDKRAVMRREALATPVPLQNSKFRAGGRVADARPAR